MWLLSSNFKKIWTGVGKVDSKKFEQGLAKGVDSKKFEQGLAKGVDSKNFEQGLAKGHTGRK